VGAGEVVNKHHGIVVELSDVAAAPDRGQRQLATAWRGKGGASLDECLALGNKIGYVLAHTRFMRSCQLSSFDGHRVGQYLTSLHRCIMG
jgi:hypothetical protein